MASKYLQKFPIPNGFPKIFHDFTKEILRDQPKDIVDYAYLYFKALEENQPFDYPHKGTNIPPSKTYKPPQELKQIAPKPKQPFIDINAKQEVVPPNIATNLLTPNEAALKGSTPSNNAPASENPKKTEQPKSERKVEGEVIHQESPSNNDEGDQEENMEGEENEDMEGNEGMDPGDMEGMDPDEMEGDEEMPGEDEMNGDPMNGEDPGDNGPEDDDQNAEGAD